MNRIALPVIDWLKWGKFRVTSDFIEPFFLSVEKEKHSAGEGAISGEFSIHSIPLTFSIEMVTIIRHCWPRLCTAEIKQESQKEEGVF